MQRILVVSDSHNKFRILDTVIKKLSKSVTDIIHLGDHCFDMDKYINLYPHINIYRVSGNCDYSEDCPQSLTVDFSGIKIFMCHGHFLGVKSGIERIFYTAKENDAKIALFGHTHFPFLEKLEDVTIMNPGSISMPRGVDYESYGMINISDTEAEISIVKVRNLGYKVVQSIKL